MWVKREDWERVIDSMASPLPDWVMVMDLRSRREAGLNVGRRALSTAWGCSERKASTVLRETKPQKPDAADIEALREVLQNAPDAAAGWAALVREAKQELAARPPLIEGPAHRFGTHHGPKLALQALTKAWLRDRLDEGGDWPRQPVAMQQLEKMWSEMRSRIETDLPGIHLDTMRRELLKLYQGVRVAYPAGAE